MSMAFMIRPSRRFPVQCLVLSNAGPYRKLLLTCFAGIWCLIALGVLRGEPVSAEWVALDEPYQSLGLQIVYVDPTTIRQEGNLVMLWQLTDYRWKQGGIVGRRFLSSKTQKQFDCPARRYRRLVFIDFSGHMGTGDPRDGYVDQDIWLPVEPETLNHALWEVACGEQ